MQQPDAYFLCRIHSMPFTSGTICNMIHQVLRPWYPRLQLNVRIRILHAECPTLQCPDGSNRRARAVRRGRHTPPQVLAQGCIDACARSSDGGHLGREAAGLCQTEGGGPQVLKAGVGPDHIRKGACLSGRIF